ncbi:MAG TPA: hypothetical protein VKV31_00935 [bacterium]|nr:hypothetical protein [bacterium]
MEEVEITLLFESKDKVEVERFKRNLLEQISPQMGIRFLELSFDKKEDLSTRGRELAEKFFNAAVGLGAIMASESQEHQESSGLAFTPEWFSSTSKTLDERTLAECYVYAKTFGLNDFPAVLANKIVVTAGRLPSIEEVASQLKITAPPKEPLTQSVSQETKNIPVPPQEMDAQNPVQIQQEPLYVHLAQEQTEPTALNSDISGEQETAVASSGPSITLDEQTKARIVEVLKRTGFRGPGECTDCLYFIENESRCALLHISISDVKKPVCRLNLG